jgi:hypothetical protein
MRNSICAFSYPWTRVSALAIPQSMAEVKSDGFGTGLTYPDLYPDFIRNAGIHGADLEQNTKRQPQAESEL